MNLSPSLGWPELVASLCLLRMVMLVLCRGLAAMTGVGDGTAVLAVLSASEHPARPSVISCY